MDLLPPRGTRRRQLSEIRGGAHLADLNDKTAGKAKEIAGEILGDGNLAEEGKQQKDERHEEKDAEPDPPEGLRKLT